MKILIGKALQILIVVTTLVSAMESTGDEHVVKDDERRRLTNGPTDACPSQDADSRGACEKVGATVGSCVGAALGAGAGFTVGSLDDAKNFGKPGWKPPSLPFGPIMAPWNQIKLGGKLGAREGEKFGARAGRYFSEMFQGTGQPSSDMHEDPFSDMTLDLDFTQLDCNEEFGNFAAHVFYNFEPFTADELRAAPIHAASAKAAMTLDRLLNGLRAVYQRCPQHVDWNNMLVRCRWIEVDQVEVEDEVRGLEAQISLTKGRWYLNTPQDRRNTVIWTIERTLNPLISAVLSVQRILRWTIRPAVAAALEAPEGQRDHLLDLVRKAARASVDLAREATETAEGLAGENRGEKAEREAMREWYKRS